MNDHNLFFISKTSQFSTLLKLIVSFVFVFLIFSLQNILDPIVFFLYSGSLTFIGKNELIDSYSFMYFIALTSIFLLTLTIHSFLKIYNTKYYFYDDILIIEKGILNKTKSQIEYFRIKDYNIRRSLIARILGRCSLDLITTDRTHRNKKLKLINHFYENRQKIRNAIKTVMIETGRGREVEVL